MTKFTIDFEGDRIAVVSGQTLAAALLAAGHRELRQTRFGSRPRGVYCGIGVCFDCLMVVNGNTSQRACLYEPAPGDSVCRQQASGWSQQ
jgi:D-hydroxyproline dehydrogenase subunit gamma